MGRTERGIIQVPVAGVTLLAVLMLIAVGTILMGQAMETWDSQVRHELEEDLIFRGQEYRRAIEMYQAVNRRYPTKLEELCPKEKADYKFIRRCWNDPITGKKFRLIGPGEAGKRRALNEGRRPADGGDGDDGDDGGKATGGRIRGAGPRDSNVTWSDVKWSKEQPKGDRPFQGVASDSDREGFRTYNGLAVYSEWEFVAANAAAARSTPRDPRATPTPGDPRSTPAPTPPGGR